MKTLTVKEALEQGYTKYGFSYKEWQTTNDLHEDIFKEIEYCDMDHIVLFVKTTECPSISKELIAKVLPEYIGDNDSSEICREDDSVYKAVNEINFETTEMQINKVLEGFKYWRLTDIKLIN